MKNFSVGEEVLFLKDYDDEKLSRGWILKKEYSPIDGDDICSITNKRSNIEQSPNNNDLIKRRSLFILRFSQKRAKKYNKIHKFLKHKLIQKHIDSISEKARFLKKSNSRTRIMLIIILKAFNYVWKNFVVGTINLFFGDLFAYYPNSINKNNKIEELKNKNNEIKLFESFLPYGELGWEKHHSQIEIKRNEKQKIEDEIKEIDNRISETSRAFIAMVLALISLIIASAK